MNPATANPPRRPATYLTGWLTLDLAIIRQAPRPGTWAVRPDLKEN